MTVSASCEIALPQFKPEPTTLHTMSERWAAVPRERWAKACHYPGGGLRDAELREILPELYALFPQPGKKSHQEMPVWVLPGGMIDEHSHPEYTLVYYIDAGDPPCAIIVDGARIVPAPNTAILLPPHTRHYVERCISNRPRLSLALRWEMTTEKHEIPSDKVGN